MNFAASLTEVDAGQVNTGTGEVDDGAAPLADGGPNTNLIWTVDDGADPVLRITGTAAADQVRIELDANDRTLVNVFLGNGTQPVQTRKLQAIEAITISTGAGDDAIVIGSGVTVPGGIRLDAGAGSDSLTIAKDARAITVQDRVLFGPGTGRLTVGSTTGTTTINFQGLDLLDNLAPTPASAPLPAIAVGLDALAATSAEWVTPGTRGPVRQFAARGLQRRRPASCCGRCCKPAQGRDHRGHRHEHRHGRAASPAAGRSGRGAGQRDAGSDGRPAAVQRPGREDDRRPGGTVGRCGGRANRVGRERDGSAPRPRCGWCSAWTPPASSWIRTARRTRAGRRCRK